MRQGTDLDMRQAREEAKDTGLALVLLTLLLHWLGEYGALMPVAIVLLLTCILRPQVYRPLVGPWRKLGEALGAVASRIVLTLLFFLVVTPVGLLRRMAGADPMQLRQWRRGSASAMHRRDHRFCPEDLEKPY